MKKGERDGKGKKGRRQSGSGQTELQVFESGSPDQNLRQSDKAAVKSKPSDDGEGLHLHAAGKKEDGRWKLQFMSNPKTKLGKSEDQKGIGKIANQGLEESKYGSESQLVKQSKAGSNSDNDSMLSDDDFNIKMTKMTTQ